VSDTEMRRRMVLAGSVKKRLSKSIFRRHDVSLDLKLRLYNSCVVPMFKTSHTEVNHRVSQKHIENQLNAYINRCSRLSMAEISWTMII